MPSVRVITLHYGAAPYLSVSRRINERYCHKQGVDFVVVDREQRGRRDALWSKVTRAREQLDGCDLLVYLDADAVFVDHAAPIETLADLLPDERVMLIGEDDKPGIANTGVWALRNTHRARVLLDTWDTATDRDKTLRSRWPLDEGGFNEQVMPAHRADIELKPRRELDLVTGGFIQHPMGLTLSAKADALTAIAKRIGL